MEFTLRYYGNIRNELKTKAGPEEKHNIRIQFHPQIKELWGYEPLSLVPEYLNDKHDEEYIKNLSGPIIDPGTFDNSQKTGYIIKRNTLKDGNSYWFAPLICKPLRLYAELDITYLGAQDHMTPTVIRGGDIDNKLKVLFDGLRYPSDNNLIPNGLSPISEDDPIHCLLEDDSLIRKITVSTDRLLDAADKDYVMILIKVKVKSTIITPGNMPLVS
ncbi:MAG: hypothetical protein HQK96_07555 [Nitrospirae bacterium]|nr:hypothetical protein [Nitrospirota bacterium]